MHLQSAQTQVLEARGAGINRLDLLESNAKFILVSAGADLGVSACGYVRIYAHGDRGDFSRLAGNGVDALELGLALGVEAVHALSERKADFLTGLADAGKRALSRV